MARRRSQALAWARYHDGICYGPWSQLRDAGYIDGNTQWDYRINDEGRKAAES